MNTRSYKHSVLGLVLLSLMSFDAFAETRGSWLSGKHHSGQVTLDAAYGDKQNSHGTVDLLYPLYERSDAIGFIDVRGMLREGSASEFNLGGGYRWLNDSQTQLYGVYGFYDAKQSVNSKNYTQLTLGGEWKMANYSLGGNVYIPMGTQKNEVSRKQYPQLITNPAQADTFLVSLNDDVLYEYAYQGLDIEAGYQVPQLPGLTTYLGAYHFTHKDADAITGPRLSVEYDVLQHIKQAPSWLDSVDVVANVQHDNVRETLWSIGMRVSIPLGTPTDKRTVTGLQKALASVVRRDKDIVTSQAIEVESETLTKADGTPFVGKMVTTPDALLDVTTRAKTTGLAIDIVAVAGNLSMPGVTTPAQGADGLLTTATIRNTDAAVVLTDKQILTGGALTLTYNGNVYSVPVVEQSAALAGASATTQGSITLLQEDAAGGFVQTGHLLRVGQNNRIEDIALIVPAGNAANNQNGQQSAAITNTMGIIAADDTLTNGKVTYKTNGSNFVPFGSLALQNVTVTGGGMVYLNVDKNAATESTVTIDGGTYNITNPYVGRSYDTNEGGVRVDALTSFGAITLIDQGDGAMLGNHQLSGMAITVVQEIDAEQYRCTIGGVEKNCREIPVTSGITASHLNGVISNNQIAASSTGEGANIAGVYLQKTLDGVIGCGEGDTVNCSNEFNELRSTKGNVTGVFLGDSVAGGSMTAASRISGNTFNGAIAGDDEGHGIAAAGTVSGTISGNTFNGAITGDVAALGVFTIGTVSGTISGNTFNGAIGTGDVGAAAGAYGIAAGGSTVSGTISGNIFNGAITGSVLAYGILTNTVSGTIGCGADQTDNCANKFGVIESTEGTAAGVSVGIGFAFAANLGDGADSPGHIRGNTFEQVKGVTFFPVSGIVVAGAVNANSSISNNQFGVKVNGDAITGNAIDATATDATASVAGIIVNGTVSGTIGCGADQTNNCANKFGVIESTGGHAAGVYVFGALVDATGVNPGYIRGNTFEQIKGAKNLNNIPVSGILVFGVVNTNSSISNNQFGVKVNGDARTGNAIDATATGATAGVAGIYVTGAVFGTIGCAEGETDTANCKNTFGTISASGEGASANGIVIGEYVPAGNGNDQVFTGTLGATGKINGNEFGAITSALGRAYGIKVFKETAQGSEINNNTFTGTIASRASAAVGGKGNPNAIASVITIGHVDDDGNSVEGTIAAGTVAGNVASNTVNAVSAAVLSTGININGQLTGTISGNAFNGAITGDGVVVGIGGGDIVTGTIGCGAGQTDNCANKFGVIEFTEGYAAGVIVVGDLGDAAGNPGHIRGNTFKQVKGAANDGRFPVSGILVVGNVNAHSSISNNQFGVKVNGDAITGNAIDATAAGAAVNVAGIYVNDAVSGTIGCGADQTDNCANKFGVIESAGGHAVGVYVGDTLGDADGDNPGHIRGNTFEQVKGADDFAFFPISGILVTGAVNANSSISNNQFGVKVSGDAIAGNAINATAAANAVGIYVVGAVTGTIGCGAGQTDNCANKFGVIESTGGHATGVIVGALGDAGGGTPGHIRGNTFEQVKGADDFVGVGFPVSGILVAGNVNAHSSISNNQFGVKVNGGAVTGNAIDATATGATASVAGIYALGTVSGTIGCDVGTAPADSSACKNTFASIASTTGYAIGLFVLGASSGNINFNEFTVEASDATKNAYGISFGEAFIIAANAEKVTNNTLNVTHTAIPGNAIGISLANGDNGAKTALDAITTNIFSDNIETVNKVKTR